LLFFVFDFVVICSVSTFVFLFPAVLRCFDLFGAVSHSFLLFSERGGEQRRGRFLGGNKKGAPRKSLMSAFSWRAPRKDSWEARAARQRNPGESGAEFAARIFGNCSGRNDAIWSCRGAFAGTKRYVFFRSLLQAETKRNAKVGLTILVANFLRSLSPAANTFRATRQTPTETVSTLTQTSKPEQRKAKTQNIQ